MIPSLSTDRCVVSGPPFSSCQSSIRATGLTEVTRSDLVRRPRGQSISGRILTYTLAAATLVIGSGAALGAQLQGPSRAHKALPSGTEVLLVYFDGRRLKGSGGIVSAELVSVLWIVRRTLIPVISEPQANITIFRSI